MEPTSESSITLRPFTMTDLDDYFLTGTDARLFEFVHRDPFPSKEVARSYLQDAILPHPWCRGICLDGRVVREMPVTMGRGTDSCRGSVGYAVAYQQWGKGVATVAVKMMLRTIFEEFPNLERIEGLVDSENYASQRVLEKAGFVKEGLLRKYNVLRGKTRDKFVYSFVRGDHVPE